MSATTIKKIDRAIDHFRAYHYGEPFEGEPVQSPHSFDFTREDGEIILAALNIAKQLAEHDYPHNFQREASWVAAYCYDMTSIQTQAKAIND